MKNKYIDPMYSSVFLPFNQGKLNWYMCSTHLENSTDRVVEYYNGLFSFYNSYLVYRDTREPVPESSEIRIVPTLMSMGHRWFNLGLRK